MASQVAGPGSSTRPTGNGVSGAKSWSCPVSPMLT